MQANSSRLNIVFMGTPDFAVPALRRLVAGGHRIAAVYTQPPRPAGRGGKIRQSPVHSAAVELGISVRTPASLRDPAEQAALAALSPATVIVAAYGLILPQAVLDIPRLGCINIHASLLPRWRGAAPIQRAIMAGDPETGVTIMKMEAGLDTGPMLAKLSTPISAADDCGALHDRLAAMGAKMVVDSLDDWAAGKIIPQPQPSAGVTHAAKITREDENVDWRKPAIEIERQIRALSPWPVASFATGNEERIKVMKAELVPEAGTDRPAGALLGDDFSVACGDGKVLRVLMAQRQGRSPADAASVLRGMRLPAGHVFP